jgi:hypothetical protein
VADGFDRGRIVITPPADLFITVPSLAPLAPLMSELTHGVIDVFMDAPELLPSVDFGELREDLD